MRILLQQIIAARGFDDAEDIAAVLNSRIASVMAQDAGVGRPGREPAMVVGFIPTARGPMEPDVRHALDEHSAMMEAQAGAVLDAALLARAPGPRRALGPAPRGSAAAEWRHCARTVAAYRNRYGSLSARALGPSPGSMAQVLDAACARAALRAAQQLAEKDHVHGAYTTVVQSGLPTVGIRF